MNKQVEETTGRERNRRMEHGDEWYVFWVFGDFRRNDASDIRSPTLNDKTTQQFTWKRSKELVICNTLFLYP